MKILSIIFILLFLGVLFICGSAIFDNTPPYAASFVQAGSSAGGDILVGLNRYNDSLIFYNKALSLKSDDEHAIKMKDLALEQLGRQDEALKISQEVSEKNPGKVGPIISEGDIYYKKGDITSAQEKYSAALAIDPENTDALIRKASILCSQGRFSETIEICDRVLAKNPKNALVWLLKGDAYLGKSNDGLSNYKKLIDQYENSNDKSAAEKVNEVYVEDYKKAVDSYEKARTYNPALAITVAERLTGNIKKGNFIDIITTN